jgi:hypothetical protein
MNTALDLGIWRAWRLLSPSPISWCPLPPSVAQVVPEIKPHHKKIGCQAPPTKKMVGEFRKPPLIRRDYLLHWLHEEAWTSKPMPSKPIP